MRDKVTPLGRSPSLLSQESQSQLIKAGPLLILLCLPSERLAFSWRFQRKR
jgi:hypothetical protein